MIDGKTFVTLWQTSASLHEFCRKSGMTPQNACNKAKRLRDFGVQLKAYKVLTIKRAIDERELAELKVLALQLLAAPAPALESEENP